MPTRKVIAFPGPGPTATGTTVPGQRLYLGRFTAEERASIIRRFHVLEHSIERLARCYGVGHSLIQSLVRIKRPMGIAVVNERRGKRSA